MAGRLPGSSSRHLGKRGRGGKEEEGGGGRRGGGGEEGEGEVGLSLTRRKRRVQLTFLEQQWQPVLAHCQPVWCPNIANPACVCVHVLLTAGEFSITPPSSSPPSLPPSLLPFLLLTLPPSNPPSLPPSLLPYFPSSLPPFLPPSLFPSTYLNAVRFCLHL